MLLQYVHTLVLACLRYQLLAAPCCSTSSAAEVLHRGGKRLSYTANAPTEEGSTSTEDASAGRQAAALQQGQLTMRVQVYHCGRLDRAQAR